MASLRLRAALAWAFFSLAVFSRARLERSRQ